MRHAVPDAPAPCLAVKVVEARRVADAGHCVARLAAIWHTYARMFTLPYRLGQHLLQVLLPACGEEIPARGLLLQDTRQ